MLILGLDFETTGLKPETARVIEIGAILWDTERKTALQVFNMLIKHSPEDQVTITKETEDLTHILKSDIDTCGVSPTVAFQGLLASMGPAAYIVAHNGLFFDKQFLESELRQLGLPACSKPWLDTRWDVPYPEGVKERNGEKLRLFHGVENLFPHRAVFDVLSMLQILAKYEINDVIALSEIPLIKIQALVGYEERDKAKSRGYFWNKESKIWAKFVRQNVLENEKKDAPFEIQVLV